MDIEDSDAEDESNSTGGTSVLRVAGLARLQQVPARLRKVWPPKPNNPVKKKPYARATVQRCHATKLLGLTFEPFANLSPALSRAFARSVFASCVPVLLYFQPWVFGRSPYRV